MFTYVYICIILQAISDFLVEQQRRQQQRFYCLLTSLYLFYGLLLNMLSFVCCLNSLLVCSPLYLLCIMFLMFCYFHVLSYDFLFSMFLFPHFFLFLLSCFYRFSYIVLTFSTLAYRSLSRLAPASLAKSAPGGGTAFSLGDAQFVTSLAFC